MKKIIFIVFSVLCLNLYAQSLPKNFSIYKNSEGTTDEKPGSNTVERILIQDNNIWLATSRGLSRTNNEGSTFVNYYNDEVFGTEGISALGYYAGTIWAAKWHSEENAGSDVPTGGGLVYSTDYGNTWVKIEQPVDNPGDSSITYGINKIRALPVTVSQENFIYQIALTKNTIWIAAKAGGLRKSTDMGVTWQRVVLPPDYLNSIKPTDSLKFSLQPVAGAFGKESYLNHRVFSVIAIDDDTLYVGTAGGINKSTDGGVSWVKFNHTNQENPISGNFVLIMDRNRADNSIWAATWKAEGSTEYYAVSFTTNGGRSWQITLPDEKVHDFGFNYYGTQDNYSSSDVLAATETGLYRANNSSSTWIAARSIMDSQTNYYLNSNKFLSVESQKLSESEFNIWVGSNDDGLVKFNDKTGSWNGDWKIFLQSGKKITPSETFAFPSPFSPDNDITRIKYNVGNGSSVTIRIFDFGMNLVRTLIQNASRSSNNEQMEIWDGKDEVGKIVPNGVYFYRIDIGSQEPLFGKIMVLM